MPPGQEATGAVTPFGVNGIQELRDSHRMLTTLLSNLPGMVYRCRNDQDWTMEFASEGCLALTGFPPSDFLHNAVRSYAGIIHAEDRDRVWQEVQEALAAGQPFQLVYRIVPAQGAPKWVWEQGRGVYGPGQQLLGLEGFITDISERKRAEQFTLRLGKMYAALSATNEAILRARSPDELYRKVCDAAVHGGKFIAAAAMLIESGTAWVKLMVFSGAAAGEWANARIAIDETHPEGRGLVGIAYRTRRPAISNDYMNDARLHPWREKGRAIGANAAAAIPLLRDGQVSGVLLFFSGEKDAFDEEIVKLLERMAENVVFALDNFARAEEQARAAEALRASEARFRSLTELSSDWYWEQDENLRFTKLSERAADDSITGLLGKARWELPGLVVDPAARAALQAKLEAREAFYDFEYKQTQPDGSARYFITSGTPMFDAAGRFLGYRGVTKDITARKREEALLALEHAVNRALAEAKSASEAIRASIRAVCATEGWECGRYFRVDKKEDVLRFADGWGIPDALIERYLAASAGLTYPMGKGIIGRVWQTGEPIWVSDRGQHIGLAHKIFGESRDTFVFPLLADGKVVGVYNFIHRKVRAPDARLLQAVRVIGSQIGQFIQRKEAEEVMRESEARFKSLTELSSDWYWEQDQELRFTRFEGRYVRSSSAFEDYLGKRLWDEPFEPEGGDGRLAQVRRAMLENREPFYDLVLHARLPDGNRICMSVSGEPFWDAQGNFRGYRGTGRDVTERMRALAQTRKLSSAMQQTADCVIITDRRGVIEYVNAAFERTTGFSAAEAVGRTPSLVKSGVHDTAFYERLWRTVLAGEIFSEVFINRKKNGELYYEEKTISPLRDEQGRITHFISTGKDITERMQAQERLQHIAHHDALTGLPNRILFLDRLEQALLRRGHGGERVVAVMFLDLDRFKNVNDTLGHDIGDAVLKAMAVRLQGCVREADSVARLGGDEFAVLLEDVAHAEDVSTIAGKILGAFTLPFVVHAHELFITASIGISLYPADGTTAATLLKNADAAMYRAKDLGKNNYQFYSADMSAAAFERLTLESSLRRALEREEFVLHYQPQVDLANGRLIGVEALLRWQHPEFGLLAPTQFISIAEETGVIMPLGAWVARKAMTQVKQWRAAGFPELRVAVNVSGRQFNEPNFLETIAQLLKEADLPPAALELEITESVIMKNAERTVQRLRALHGMGVRFAIDDFGTGYSSLSYLRRFSLSTLKIDKSFIRHMTAGSGDVEIVKTIIMMARGLKLAVVAEGVETREQLMFLKAYGCHAVQGYLVARPLAADALTERLSQSTRPWLP